MARERVGLEAGEILWKAAAGIELGVVAAATEVRQTGTYKGAWTRKGRNKMSRRT